MFLIRIKHLPVWNNNSLYKISGLSGTLFSYTEEDCKSHPSYSLTNKIRNVKKQCENPYLLKTSLDKNTIRSFSAPSPKIKSLGKRFINRLIWLSQRQFLCARLYASWSVPIFESATEASLFFRKYAEGDQDELCLARALFAAKTSRRFAEHGAVIIGVFLPSRAMHAWVIEGDVMADPYDVIWINYQPIAMLS
jgi:hypothetical protein